MKFILLAGAAALTVATSLVCPAHIRAEVSEAIAPSPEMVADARDAFDQLMDSLLRSAPDGYEPEEAPDAATLKL
ncbi:MAG: hypothetical protein AAFX09_03135 [Pseudomonadota bacterium]